MHKKVTSEFKKIVAILLLTVIYSFCFKVFVVNQQIISGGFNGLVQIILIYVERSMHIKLNYGVILLLSQVPLLILAWLYLDKKFTIRTVITLVSLSQIIAFIPDEYMITHNKLLAAVAASTVGIVVGLLFSVGACTGGIDIISFLVLKRFPNSSVGAIGIIFNTVVLSFNLLLFDAESLLYSIIVVFGFGIGIDYVHHKNIKVTALIITTKEKEVFEAISSGISRSVTSWDGKGLYTGNKKKVLICTMSKYEFNLVKKVVKTIDEESFINVWRTSEVIGRFNQNYF